MATAQPLTNTLPLSSHAPGTLLQCDSDRVGVLVSGNGRRLVAIRSIVKGARVLAIIGRETQVATRYSVQVASGLHLDQDCARDEADVVKRYFWRYMDHHCEPTTIIRNREVIALRNIAEGDGITFNYNTTEYDMAAPFRCHCGSALCVGRVRGARHMTAAQRDQVARWLPAYLR